MIVAASSIRRSDVSALAIGFGVPALLAIASADLNTRLHRLAR